MSDVDAERGEGKGYKVGQIDKVPSVRPPGRASELTFVGEQVQCTYRRLLFLPTNSSVSSWMEVAGASYNTGKGGILSLERCTARVTHIYLRSSRTRET